MTCSGREAVRGGELGEVGAEVAAVADGDFDGARRRKRNGVEAVEVLVQRAFKIGVAGLQRIELDEQGSVGGMQIADVGKRLGFEQAQKFEHAFAGFGRDGFTEIDEQGLIAGELESRARRVGGHLRRGGS